MSQQVTVTLFCDLDHGPHDVHEDVRTVTFALDGVPYEIDVCAIHLDKLRADLGPYTIVGRRAPRANGNTPGRRRNLPAPAGVNFSAVRAWAKSPDGQQALNGQHISGRGRLPAHIIALYEQRTAIPA